MSRSVLWGIIAGKYKSSRDFDDNPNLQLGWPLSGGEYKTWDDIKRRRKVNRNRKRARDRGGRNVDGVIPEEDEEEEETRTSRGGGQEHRHRHCHRIPSGRPAVSSILTAFLCRVHLSLVVDIVTTDAYVPATRRRTDLMNRSDVVEQLSPGQGLLRMDLLLSNMRKEWLQ